MYELKMRAEIEALRRQLADAATQTETQATRTQIIDRDYQRTRAELNALKSALACANFERDLLLVPQRDLIRKELKNAWWLLTFRRNRKLREQHDLLRRLKLLAASPLFQAQWYLEQYPDVASSGANPIFHYFTHGAIERRNPSPRFDGNWYLQRHPDVMAAGANPLVHYLESGIHEGRERRPLILTENGEQDLELLRDFKIVAKSSFFDSQWYLQTYPDVAAAGEDPIVHYLRYGAAEGRNPGPRFDGNWYVKTYSDVMAARLNPLIHYLENGVAEGRRIRAVDAVGASADSLPLPSVSEALQFHFPALRPMRTFLIPSGTPRITVVTEGVSERLACDGAATALIVSALLAKRTGAALRVVTRTERLLTAAIGDVLSASGISWEDDIEFVYCPPNGNRHVPSSDDDIFLTTSWQTTRSVREVVNPSRIVYVLQEDERMLYPFDDERLRCEEILADPEIRFVVNSEMLFEHLTTGPEALDSIRRRGIWFEKAFPASHYPESRSARAKKSFFFYARPGNAPSLYWRGIEAIAECLRTGALQRDDWEFFFENSGSKVALPGGTSPTILQNLTWPECIAVMRRTDAALCLVDTPYPSYPELDLVASGAVVVTSRRGRKTSLDRYSDNILCVEPKVEKLQEGIGQAINLASDDALRFENHARNRIARDWTIALEVVLQRLAPLVGKV